MKLSYNLLKQFVNTKHSPQELARIVTEHSLEMTVQEKASGDFSGIITAKVLEINKHPNADRLRIVKAEAGGKIYDPIVCGAFNFGVGDMVALALPGAKIAQNIHSEAHEPFVLQKAKIRGVESQGMICAAFELGLEDKPGEGIMLLDKNTKTGISLNKVLTASEQVFEASLPANRPDLFSHLGMAREIAAILNAKIKEPKLNLPRVNPSKTWKVSVLDKTLCPKYIGARLSGIQIKESPKFIQDTLKAVGIRPLNNVVDITNYVMIELGQPLHAFNAKKVTGNIIVRKAKPQEKFSGINHKDYELDISMLVIADEAKSLALAGIIGGLNSEINDNTFDIILEAANFNGINVRKTSRKLGIRTDSSHLFEKQLHPKQADMGIARAISLLQTYAGAKLESINISKLPEKTSKAVKFTTEGVNKLLGSNFKANEIKKLLSRFQIKVSGNKTMSATPPWWRTDLENEADMAEEVLKLAGYNSIKLQPLQVPPVVAFEYNHLFNQYIRESKELWARLGFAEAQNYNFVSENDIIKFGANPKDYIAVENPLSRDQAFLKRHLLIPLLKNASLNQKYFEEFKIFEIGRQYLSFENEPTLLTAVTYGKNYAIELLAGKLKASVLEYFRQLGIQNIVFQQTDKPWMEIKSGGQTVGLIGMVQEAIIKNFDIDEEVAFVKLELEKIYKLKSDVLFKPYSKFPKISRDVSIIIEKSVTWARIEELIKPISPLITSITLFEAPFLATEKSSKKYHEELSKKGLKNLGIRLEFQSLERTLKEEEVTGILGQIVLKLQQEIKAEVR